MHAIYLATIAQYASTNWGVNFNSVEAFNEPSATWWYAEGTQEGCHFDTNTQADVIGYLRTELDNRGLSAVQVAASDENTYDEATATWQSFGAIVQADVGQVNTHGYEYGGGRRDLLYDAVAERNFGTASMERMIRRDCRWPAT
jgi:galactan endo-1,6-beta-galactosidase